MKGDLQHIDDLFRAGLEGKEEMPSDKVWDAIDQDLDKTAAVSISKKYARLRQVSAILLILLLGVSIYALRNNFISRSGNQGLNQKTGAAGANRSEQVSTDHKVGTSVIPKSVVTVGAKASNGTGSAELNTTSANPVSSGDVSAKTGSAELHASPANPVSPGNVPTGKTNSISPSNRSIHANSVAQSNKKSKTQVGQKSAKNIPSVNTSIDEPVDNIAVENNSTRNKLEKVHGVENAALVTGAANTTRTLAIQENSARTGEMNSLVRATLLMPKSNLTSLNTLSAASGNSNAIPVKNKRIANVQIPKFSFTPLGSLNFISNKIEDNHNHTSWMVSERDEIENTESQKLSYSFGLLADYKIAPRITLMAGLSLTQQTTTINPKAIRAVRDDAGKIKYKFECSAGTYYINPKYGTMPSIGDTAYTIYSENKLQYINLPVGAKYHFSTGRLTFYGMAGFAANFLVKQHLQTGLQNTNYYGKPKQPKVVGLNNAYFDGILGAGLDYSLGKRFALSFMPNYRFALTSINKDMPIKAYPRMFSLAAGVRISL